MSKYYNNTALVAVVLGITSIGLTGCLGGSSSSNGSSGGDGAPFEGNLSGQLTAPNGESPIPNASVYIPDDAVGAASFQATAAPGDGQCAEPGTNYIAWTCTDADGNFAFDVDKEEGSTVTLRARKGGWSLTREVTLSSASVGAVSFSNDPEEGAARIAVVTGGSDRIQDVLAKIGMGELGEVSFMSSDDGSSSSLGTLGHGHDGHSHGGFTTLSSDCDPQDYGMAEWPDDMTDEEIAYLCDNLDPGDIDYGDIDDGDFGDITFSGLELGTETFSLYDGDLSLPDDYDSVEALFSGDTIFDYDIVYVNCGARNPNDSNWTSLVQDYVAQGGVLYVTDLSDDYVVQPFSDYLQWKTSGESTDSVTGEIVDTDLANWLSGVPCTNGSCLAGNNTFNLTGIAGGWSLLEKVNEDEVETLVRADVSELVYGSISEDVQPMTMRFNHEDGLVIYSSYHTSDFMDGGGNDFIPQERVLEYLFYENVN